MRLQLALNVDSLEEGIAFYSKMFGTEPVKIHPGYANFAIENPPLKLVLFEGAGPNGSLNHLGVETMDASEVEEAEARLAAAGLAPTPIDETICCYAEKVETWVHAPDGNRWEWYVKQGDADQIDFVSLGKASTECCASAPVPAVESDTACCSPATVRAPVR